MIQGAPLPVPDYDTERFWDGCRQGEFLIPQCGSCGALRWPPGPMCPSCQGTETNWLSANGHGRLYTWIVAHHPANPAMADAIPYVVGLIELDEGVRVVGNVRDCGVDQLEAGLEVELFFERVDEDVTLPNFRIARTES